MNSRLSQIEHPGLEKGQTFADYRIEELAGRRRGPNRVYVATHLESERQLEFPPWPVALKVFLPPAGQEAEFKARFDETAKLQAALHHPNVVSVYEVGSDPLPFISMTLFRGPTLADLISSGQLDEPALLPIISSVAAALDGGREHGLVYRRLRPGGVLVAADAQRAFLGDFGVGRAARIPELFDNEELGTFLDYISPEEARGEEVSAASNVYSLGSIAFECLTGEPPYQHQEGEQSLRARLEEPPRRLRALRPDLPASLESVVARALEAEPHQRPASAGQLAKAIERAYPKRRRRAARLRATTVLAKTPALPASEPATPAVEAAPAREQAAPTETPAAAGKPRAARPLARRLPSPAFVLAALLIAGAALVGALVAPGPKADLAPVAAEELATGTVNLRFPSNWNRLDEAPPIPGVSFRETAGLASGSAPGAGPPARALVAGQGSRIRPPASVDPQPVDLGAVQAYRYRGVKGEGLRGQANLYVVPTSGDSIVIACVAPSAKDPFMSSCERVASTLSLTGSAPVAIAPSPTYARSLRRIVRRLDAVRGSARRRLSGARTRNGQAGNAARLSIAYRVARRSASRLAAPPGARGAHQSIVRALSRAGRAYREMAAAARGQQAGAWASSRGAALAGEQALQRALGDLRTLGYHPG